MRNILNRSLAVPVDEEENLRQLSLSLFRRYQGTKGFEGANVGYDKEGSFMCVLYSSGQAPPDVPATLDGFPVRCVRMEPGLFSDLPLPLVKQ